MKFEYTGRHLDVTPALRSHVENHFEKISHLFTKSNAKAQIIIEVERGKHLAEIIVKWNDHTLTANGNKTDMYQSLTQAIDKIEKQALKLKNKVTDQHLKAKKAAKNNTVVSEPETAEDTSKKIFADTRYTVKPMTPEEAILKIKKDYNFVVFRDAETNKISVLYVRQDGNYGLIQP